VSAWFEAENEAAIASPALFVHRERVEENIALMLQIAGDPGRLRPHVKTHKLAPIVRAQLARSITKFKCATIVEAEMTAGAGAPDVMLAFPPVGPNVARLIALARRFPATRFSTIVDSEEAIWALGEATASAGLTLDVLLDIDCGMHRTGIAPGDEAARLYRRLAQTRGLRAAGLHAYDGHIHEPDLTARTAQCEAAFEEVERLRAQLVASGLEVPALVAGGAPTFAIHARHPGRELSPGTCVLWDFGYGDKFPDLPFQPAAILLTRIVSKPCADRLCLDLGHKAVAAENPPPRVRLLELPGAEAVTHSEEHLVIATPRAAEFRIGQCLHGIPRHVCPTVALHEVAWVIEGGKVRDGWPIARGRRMTNDE
jgi:D-serine deaminase-like pyridoxal phosphate-dependent protein